MALAAIGLGVPAVWPDAAAATFPVRNGRLLYHVWCCAEADHPRNVFSVRADGTGNPAWPTRQETFRPEWSPDGRRVLFSRYLSGISVAWPDGSRARRVARIPDGSGAADSPTCAPDGRRFAFTASFEEFVGVDPETGVEDFTRSWTAVFVADLRGGKPRRIGEGSSPTWSPDGHRYSPASVDPVPTR